MSAIECTFGPAFCTCHVATVLADVPRELVGLVGDEPTAMSQADIALKEYLGLVDYPRKRFCIGRAPINSTRATLRHARAPFLHFSPGFQQLLLPSGCNWAFEMKGDAKWSVRNGVWGLVAFTNLKGQDRTRLRSYGCGFDPRDQTRYENLILKMTYVILL
jgi:hypothetical protein